MAVTWTLHVLSTCSSAKGHPARSHGLCIVSGAAVNTRASPSSHLTLPDSIVPASCPATTLETGRPVWRTAGRAGTQRDSGGWWEGVSGPRAWTHWSSPPAAIWILTCLPSVLCPSTHLTVAVRGHIMPSSRHPECQCTLEQTNTQRTCTHTPNSEVVCAQFTTDPESEAPRVEVTLSSRATAGEGFEPVSVSSLEDWT